MLLPLIQARSASDVQEQLELTEEAVSVSRSGDGGDINGDLSLAVVGVVFKQGHACGLTWTGILGIHLAWLQVSQ